VGAGPCSPRVDWQLPPAGVGTTSSRVAGAIAVVNGSEWMMATGSTVALWAMATIRHAIGEGSRQEEKATREHLEEGRLGGRDEEGTHGRWSPRRVGLLVRRFLFMRGALTWERMLEQIPDTAPPK